MLVVCVDDVLIFSREQLQIDFFIKSLTQGIENFELTNEGNIDKYLELKFIQDRMELMNLSNLT